MESRLKQLPASTVRLIGSGQVITSVYSVVKELVENALDAKATAVEIKLEKFGLEKIEVRDNGRGVQKSDVPYMGQRHFTSKITGQQDLDNLDMYGFRGEALASLCAVSEVAVTTKTIQDEVSTVYTLDHSGHVLSERASHLGQGTTILACNLFKNLPVRKQYYNSVNKKKEELKKVEDLIISFGIIRPDVRIALRHNKDVVWQKNVVVDHRTVLLQCLGTTVMKSMEHIVWHQDAENQMGIEAYLPKSDSSTQVTSRATSDRFFLYVNKRPVVLKDVEKLVRKYYTAGSGCDGSRCPIVFLSLTVPPSKLDVNVDPNKTKVLLHQKDDVCELLKKLLEQTYGPLSSKEASQGAGSKAQGTGNKMVDTESNKETDPEFTISTEKDNFTLNNGQKEDNCTTDHENGNCFSKSKSRTMLHNEEHFQIEFISGADVLGKEKEKSSVDPAVNLSTQPEFSNNCESEDILSNQKPNFNLIGEEFSDLIPQTQMATNQNDLEEMSDTSTNQTSTILRDSFSIRKDNIGLESSVSEDDIAKSTSQNNGFSEESANGRADNIVSNTTSLNPLSAEENTSKQSDSGSEDDWNDDSFFDYLLKNSKNSDAPEPQVSEKAFDFKTSSPTLGSAKRSKVNWESDSENRQDKVKNFSSKKCPESSDVDHSSGQSLINMEDWSKGRGLEGGILQPVTLLQAPTLSASKKSLNMSRLGGSPVSSSQSVRRASSTNGSKLLTGQQTLYDLIDSQPIKMQRLEGEQPKTKKRKTKEANEKNDNFPQRKVVMVNVTIQTLRKRFHSYHNVVSQPDATFETPYVIGPLKSHGVWMCRHGNSIAIFNHYRAQEVILFQRLLATFNFEMESLEQPIEITENMFPSRALWDVLLSMQQTLKPPDPHVYLTDRLLTANGFDIRMYEDDDGSKKVHIYKMATCLPFYGVQDLTEILHMVSGLLDNGYHSPNHHGGHSLDQCRPQKVRHFLQGEAVRMARKAPCNTNKDEIEDILNQFEESQNASHNNASKGLNLREVCLHNKRIWCILHNLPQFSSQDDSSILSQD